MVGYSIILKYKKHQNMENNKDPGDVIAEVLSDFLDYIKRAKAFRKEHAEYIKELKAQSDAQGLKVKPVDPQDIQKADNLVEAIEEAGLEDEIEGFDAFKYKGELYHQYRAFSAEGRYLTRRLTEAELSLSIAILNDSEDWLENAKEAIAEGDYDEGLPEAIKKMEKDIKKMKQEKAKFELQLAATHPHSGN
jgi:hypothetical protein